MDTVLEKHIDLSLPVSFFSRSLFLTLELSGVIDTMKKIESKLIPGKTEVKDCMNLNINTWKTLDFAGYGRFVSLCHQTRINGKIIRQPEIIVLVDLTNQKALPYSYINDTSNVSVKAIIDSQLNTVHLKNCYERINDFLNRLYFNSYFEKIKKNIGF